MSAQMARVFVGDRLVSESPYTPAGDYPQERIAAGLCPICPDGKGVTAYWVNTEEHLKCDSCWAAWFRGYPFRQVELFDMPT